METILQYFNVMERARAEYEVFMPEFDVAKAWNDCIDDPKNKIPRGQSAYAAARIPRVMRQPSRKNQSAPSLPSSEPDKEALSSERPPMLESDDDELDERRRRPNQFETSLDVLRESTQSFLRGQFFQNKLGQGKGQLVPGVNSRARTFRFPRGIR